MPDAEQKRTDCPVFFLSMLNQVCKFKKLKHCLKMIFVLIRGKCNNFLC